MQISVHVLLLGLCLAGTALAVPKQSEQAARDQLAQFAASSTTLAQWKVRAMANREGILRGAGLLPPPAKCPLNPMIHSQRTYDGYTVENVAFESLPGFYVTGSLYRPATATGRRAAILCPHGHFNDPKTKGHGPNDQGGRFNPELQKLPATLARMGAIAFAYDMVGWSDSTQTTHDDPNVLALQLWNSIRTVDFLLTLKGVDPERLGITGASGGGTQTMMLTAVDDRIAAAAPVVMVSAHFFGGCKCESGMPIHQSDTHETNNADISAMAVPRPQLIVSCGADWTKNVPEVEFPYVRNIYRLFGAEDRVANAHFAAEGHDYGPSKRQAVYKFFAQYFKLSLAATNETGIVIEDISTMRVFNDQHPRPATAIKGPEQTAAALQARPAGPVRLVIIGDSTVCDYPANDPCRGWGQFIQGFFNDRVRVINLAKSGRSTKTFIKEGLWGRAQNEKPDIILIQFGHNDSHGPGRPESTDAATDYRDYLRRYINEARAVGATPILVTPMHRRTFDDAGKLADILRPYADAMKSVAAERKVTVIDLHTASGQLFERLGPTGSAELANKPGDRTHFNEKGARAMAELVMKELPGLDRRVKSALAAGTARH